jgi:hypothetical protein
MNKSGGPHKLKNGSGNDSSTCHSSPARLLMRLCDADRPLGSLGGVVVGGAADDSCLPTASVFEDEPNRMSAPVT